MTGSLKDLWRVYCGHSRQIKPTVRVILKTIFHLCNPNTFRNQSFQQSGFSKTKHNYNLILFNMYYTNNTSHASYLIFGDIKWVIVLIVGNCQNTILIRTFSKSLDN